MNPNDLTELQEDIDQAKHIVFLTGAGISTHSGIPDYRSKTAFTMALRRVPKLF